LGLLLGRLPPGSLRRTLLAYDMSCSSQSTQLAEFHNETCGFLPTNLCPVCLVRSRRRIVSSYARTFKRDLKETQNLLWRISQVMKCGFMGLTQKPRNIWLRWEEHGLGFSGVYGVVRYEFVSTRTNCKPTLLHWCLYVFWGKMLSKRTWRVESEGFISPPCRCTSSLCFFVCEKVIPHPPNSSHLVLCELCLFPRLNMVLEQRRFHDISINQAKYWDTLAGFWTVDFTEYFECWCSHWTYCIKTQGNYFEGNGID
jgi:hypothetical protein